jgi:hypothetical protein
VKQRGFPLLLFFSVYLKDGTEWFVHQTTNLIVATTSPPDFDAKTTSQGLKF